MPPLHEGREPGIEGEPRSSMSRRSARYILREDNAIIIINTLRRKNVCYFAFPLSIILIFSLIQVKKYFRFL